MQLTTSQLLIVFTISLMAKSTNGLSAIDECGPDWHQFAGHCYYFNDTIAVTFRQAQQICEQDLDSHLISVHSLEEQQFIKRYFSRNLTWFQITANYYWRYHVWLGGELDPPGSGNIIWHDGSSLDFEDWDYPNHPSRECAKDGACCAPSMTLVKRGNNWIDFNCNAMYSVACKKPMPQRIEHVRPHARFESGHGSIGRLDMALVMLTVIRFVL